MREAFLGDLFGCQAAMSEWVDHILRPLVDRDDDSEDEDVVAENMDCALRYLRRLRKTVKRQDTWPPDMDVSLGHRTEFAPLLQRRTCYWVSCNHGGRHVAAVVCLQRR